MKETKFLLGLLLAFAILVVQVVPVFAALPLSESVPITGTVKSIALSMDSNTGVVTVVVTVVHDGISQTARVSLETAITLGLLLLSEDGKPLINNSALGNPIEIDPSTVIPDREETQHPIGIALATFFSDIPDVNYDAIMAAHDKGTSFGAIAQSLWLTRKLAGDAGVFLAILEAKESGNYSVFVLEDGTSPTNWGQLRKAILEGSKKGRPGVVLPGQENNGNGNNNENGKGNGNNNKDKDKDKDKDNGKDKNKPRSNDD